MNAPRRPPRPVDPNRIEILDPAVVEILRRKTPMERVQMACDAERTMRQLLTAHLQWKHPEWTPEEVDREIARRRRLGSS